MIRHVDFDGKLLSIGKKKSNGDINRSAPTENETHAGGVS
jgi:hypothetical protein